MKKYFKTITALSLIFIFFLIISVNATDNIIKKLDTFQNNLSLITNNITEGSIKGVPLSFQFTENLGQGIKKTDVMYLQKILNSDLQTRVSIKGVGSPGNENDYFGLATINAVKKFQEKYASEILTPFGLTTGTGFVGPSTRIKLNNLLKESRANINPGTFDTIIKVENTIKQMRAKLGVVDEKKTETSDSVTVEDFSSSEIIDRGYVITNEDSYNYAPSIMLENGKYRMWWCAKDDRDGDSIYYSESSNGMNWEKPRIVLQTVYGGEQGKWACDPSVVKANNDYYYLFFTSEHPDFWLNPHGAGSDGQIFLATSKDGINWTHACDRKPVIPLPKKYKGVGNNVYGIGQSSVIFMEDRFIHFYSYFICMNDELPCGTYVSESIDGGCTFKPLNNGKPVYPNDDRFGWADVKYLPKHNKFLLAVEGPQWEISFRLIDRDFNVVGKYIPPKGFSPDLLNHNPGLLGDEKGFIVDEEMVPVFFGSGGAEPTTWDIRRADFYIKGLKEIEEPKTETPKGSISCSGSTKNTITLSYRTEGDSNKSLFRSSTMIHSISSNNKNGSYTALNLSPDTEYTFTVRNGQLLSSVVLDTVKCRTLPEPEEEFCSSSSDYNSAGKINGDIVYCDRNGDLWSATAKNLYNHNNALKYCQTIGTLSYGYAGYSNWRLPTWQQLRNVFGPSACGWSSQYAMGSCDNCSSCSLDWDHNKGSYYWTSSVYDNTFSWYVDGSGGVGATPKSDFLQVRCLLSK